MPTSKEFTNLSKSILPANSSVILFLSNTEWNLNQPFGESLNSLLRGKKKVGNFMTYIYKKSYLLHCKLGRLLTGYNFLKG